MKKRLLIVLLCCLGFILIGCSDKGSKETDETPRNASSMMDEIAEHIIEAFE